MLATVDKRARAGRGCPYCSNKKVGYGNSLADRYPEIAKMWYQPQNGELTPADVTFGSGVKAWRFVKMVIFLDHVRLIKLKNLDVYIALGLEETENTPLLILPSD